MDEDLERPGLNRREFLRRAAATGAAVAWAAPLVRTIVATPAYAQTVGTPTACFHSVGGRDGGGCMSACTQSGCTGDACDGTDADPNQPGGQGPCQLYCPVGEGGDNPCCNPGLCDPNNFTCEGGVATYTGPTGGC
ncbi:MAG TPA: twin-arginine translocation signal domain-containing protein [Actinomycetota bacterium]|nr:twin-arginine translocation signal domain-containing protein [Actinomycetota bacterium]